MENKNFKRTITLLLYGLFSIELKLAIMQCEQCELIIQLS